MIVSAPLKRGREAGTGGTDVRWIAWGFRVVDGDKELYKIGELVCESFNLAALASARKRFGSTVVDHVQSALSHEIDLREAPDKLLFNRHRPRPYHRRRKPEKKLGPFDETLNDAGILNNIMSSGNSPLKV